MEDTERQALLLNTSEEKLQDWLTDENARDQFVIYNGTSIEVYWNNMGNTEPELVDYLGIYTEKVAKWSPLGTYLATIHSPGTSVWGGASFFSPLMRYHHPQVRLIDFSPGEKYLISYSRHDKYMLKIFDVKTGELKISFKGSEQEFVTEGIGSISDVCWSVIRWSGINDDRYFARIKEKMIYIYDSRTFTIIDNELMKVKNVLDFSWSPTDPILALVTANDSGSQPARVSLLNVPGREELMHKNLINVSDCKMYWQTEGDYLAILSNCLSSTNTSKYTSFEFLNTKELGIPIEDLELDNKDDNIIAFAWEPKGHRFAVIHRNSSERPDISIYALCTTEDRGWFSRLTTLKGILAHSLYWSPVGRFIILAGLTSFSGQLIFYYVDSLETLATNDFMAKDIEWSPSGRCLATFGYISEDEGTGVKIWSFSGKLLYQIPRNGFLQFLWRPRPPSFTSAKTGEEVFEDLEMTEEPTAFDFLGSYVTKRPEGWGSWRKEFDRLGVLMLKNGESTCSAENQ